jgi:hypothetical protein
LDHKSLGHIASHGPGAQTLVVRTLIEPTRVSVTSLNFVEGCSLIKLWS